MPDIQITASADVLATPDDLFDMLKELQLLGYRGSVQVGPQPNSQVPRWVLIMHVDDPNGVNGLRDIRAEVGQVKVVFGTNYTVMTVEDYTAMYGSPPS